jgi:hypothetical protein
VKARASAARVAEHHVGCLHRVSLPVNKVLPQNAPLSASPASVPPLSGFPVSGSPTSVPSKPFLRHVAVVNVNPMA